jgi:Rhs element Vgr protein
MADSPLLNADGPVRVSVFSDGTALPGGARLLSVRVDRRINQVPSAHLELADGDRATETFALSESECFKPGAVIKINAGYGDTEATLFEGIVVKHALRIEGHNQARLVVDCCDKVVRMTAGRHSANHIAQTDSEVMAQLLARYGLATNGVQATTAQHPALVQYDCSDWDFLLARAEANALLVIATDGQLTVQEPATSAPATLAVAYGQDLISFEAELDARTQLASAQAVSWEIASQAVITSDNERPSPLNAQGNLDAATLAQAVGADGVRLQSGASIGPASLGQWAKAQQLKAGLARVRGQMRFQGSAKAQVGGLITLKGTGARFDGDVLVSGLTHQISDGNWTTDVQFGLSPQWTTDQAGVTAPRAAGLLPAVEGLQIGVVTRLEGDPEGQHRVQVSVPVMQSSGQGVWARLAQLQGSGGFGSFFVPEVGDEVVLGYFTTTLRIR